MHFRHLIAGRASGRIYKCQNDISGRQRQRRRTAAPREKCKMPIYDINPNKLRARRNCQIAVAAISCAACRAK